MKTTTKDVNFTLKCFKSEEIYFPIIFHERTKDGLIKLNINSNKTKLDFLFLLIEKNIKTIFITGKKKYSDYSKYTESSLLNYTVIIRDLIIQYIIPLKLVVALITKFVEENGIMFFTYKLISNIRSHINWRNDNPKNIPYYNTVIEYLIKLKNSHENNIK